MAKEDAITINTLELYQKQTFRNRSVILTANGPQNLSVPVIRPNGKNTLVKKIEISDSENWRKDHLKAIESAYRNTPYYEYYIDAFKTIILTDFKLLHNLNTAITLFLVDKFGLTTEVKESMATTEPLKKDFLKLSDPKSDTGFVTKNYIQTFQERHGFINNPSSLDLLFNEGPNSITILLESN